MFWAQLEDNSINDILNKEDVTLEKILDHESLLQECRSQNENLIKFLTLKENYQKLLEYVFITPDERINESTRFKYSSLSCEVLTSDIPTINTLLLKGFVVLDDSDCIGFNRPYFDHLHDILHGQTIINPLTMSFCIKILLNILKFDNEYVMNLIIKRPDCMDVFLAHIDCNAIVHFFTEFVQCEDNVSEICKQWLRDNKFVCKLAKLLGLSEYRNNSVQLLFSNILCYMSLGLVNKTINSEITGQLNERDFLDIIITHISNDESDSSVVSTCLKVVGKIVEIESRKRDKKLNLCIDIILNHFQSIVHLLKKPPKQMYELMSSTIGIFQPFGPSRIEIVNLLEFLLKLNDDEVNKIIITSNILELLLTLLSKYKWNSQFHLSALRVLDEIFSDNNVDNKNYDLQKHLVQNCLIYNWFFEMFDNLTVDKPRPGYSGILWKIGNLLDLFKNSKVGVDLLSGFINIDEKWAKIVTDYLKPKNIYNEKGGLKMDSELKELDLEMHIVEIDEAEIETSCRNQETISDYFRNSTSDNLDDIFGTNLIDKSDDQWNISELQIPNAPVDDFVRINKGSTDSDDSTSSDEESPAIIRQKPQGNAAKYILSDFHNSSSDINSLLDVPEISDVEFSNLEFNDPWDKKTSDNNLVPDNWAKF